MFHDAYYADGYLFEAGYALARARGKPRLGRRIDDGSRVALFTALSAEAHINLAIAQIAKGVEVDLLHGLEVRAKLLLVPTLATGNAIFDAGVEPLGGLFALIKQRNALVHARAPEWGLSAGDSMEDTVLTVPAAGVPVDQAARWLSSLCRYLDQLEAANPSVWEHQALIARRLLGLDEGLRSWDTTGSEPKELERLLDELVDADLF